MPNFFGPRGSGGGLSSAFFIQWMEGAQAPLQDFQNNENIYLFDAADTQYLYASVLVPNGYTAGSQINLRCRFSSADTSGNVLMQTLATLIRSTDLSTSTTNQRTSTNAAITQSASTQTRYQVLTFDLTSTLGQVNAVAVSPGDTILVRLTRGTDTATGQALFRPLMCEATFQ